MPLIDLPTEMLCEIAKRLQMSDYKSFRAACRTTSTIEFDHFARAQFSSLGLVLVYPTPSEQTPLKSHTYIEAACLLRGSRALAKLVTHLRLEFSISLYGPKRQSHAQAQLCTTVSVRTIEVLPLLPKLTSLYLSGLHATGLHGDVEFNTMLEGLAESGSELAQITLFQCTVSSSQIAALLDRVPSLRTLIIMQSLCTDGWSNALSHISACGSITLTKLELSLVSEYRAQQFPDGGNKDRPKRFSISLMGEEYNYWKGGPKRHMLQTWRSPEGWQQCRLGSMGSTMSGRQAIQTGVKEILQRMTVGEELQERLICA